MGGGGGGSEDVRETRGRELIFGRTSAGSLEMGLQDPRKERVGKAISDPKGKGGKGEQVDAVSGNSPSLNVKGKRRTR